MEEKQPEPTPPPQDDKAINFAKVRKELEEKERLLQEREKQNLLLQAQIEQERRAKETTDPRFLKEEDFVNPEHYNTLLKEVDHLKRQLQETTTATARAELKAQYKDFDQIVTQDNLKKIANTRPEFIATIEKSSENAYNRLASLYHAIKLSVAPRDYQKKAEAIEEDLKRVKSVSSLPGASVAATPLIKGGRLSPEARQKFLQEIQEFQPRV